MLLTYSTSGVVNSIFGLIIGFLGGSPSAPVFMTLMGLSFYYSRNKGLKSGIRRGLQLILFGYLLNFFRGVLPVYLTGLPAPSKAAGIPAAVADYTNAFLELDILHFAGQAG
jgi:predicted alpha/beta hydrolase